jgi:glutamate N-acetyltransferase/amino-acid N-acetyltransferase
MAELHLLSPKGFVASGVVAGIKASGRRDIGMLAADTGVGDRGLIPAAAVFTTNRVVAAPVLVGREHISAGVLRGVVVNSGNANACTGRPGLNDAREMCDRAATSLGCASRSILPCSTGVIGHPLPMERVRAGIESAGRELGASADHALAFSESIMTTDATRKHAATSILLGRRRVTLAGVCKGAGMIGPRMASAGVREGARAAAGAGSRRPAHATMLAFLTTDASLTPAVLRRLLTPAADASFNSVTVDDHTSTNDTLCLLASGASGAAPATPREFDKLQKALTELCVTLAKQIASDGEGATKVVTIRVTGAKTEADARRIARAIANSPLVKCAMHGNDPNWGRIVSAAGMCGASFDPDRATLRLQGTLVFRSGRPVAFDPAGVSAALDAPEVDVLLQCGLGPAHSTLYTCDLSKQYVTINADYTT